MEEMNGNSSAIYLPGAYSPAKARKVYDRPGYEWFSFS